MANINLTAADLINTSNKIENASDRIDNALQKLDTIMNSMSQSWSDDNARMYMSRYQELKQSFPEFKNAVRSYGLFLKDVVDIYEREYNQNIAARVNKDATAYK